MVKCPRCKKHIKKGTEAYDKGETICQRCYNRRNNTPLTKPAYITTKAWKVLLRGT